jgi:RNase P subunit RPR2
MSKINVEYGLIKTFCPNAETVSCSDEKCPKTVSFMKECFLDQDGSIYCVQCGQVKRYERKKAEQRKELGLPEILINGE